MDKPIILNDVTNTEYKQTDFIKGVAHAFNLKNVQLTKLSKTIRYKSLQ